MDRLTLAAHYGATLAQAMIRNGPRTLSSRPPEGLADMLGGYLRHAPDAEELRVCMVAYSAEVAEYLGRLAGYVGVSVEVE
jgi:hypothetical protein